MSGSREAMNLAIEEERSLVVFNVPAKGKGAW
jgi:hypothetical protein